MWRFLRGCISVCGNWMAGHTVGGGRSEGSPAAQRSLALYSSQEPLRLNSRRRTGRRRCSVGHLTPSTFLLLLRELVAATLRTNVAAARLVRVLDPPTRQRHHVAVGRAHLHCGSGATQGGQRRIIALCLACLSSSSFSIKGLIP